MTADALAGLRDARRSAADFTDAERAEIAQQTKLACARMRLTGHMVDEKAAKDWIRTYERAFGCEYDDMPAISLAVGLRIERSDADRAKRARNAAERASKRAALDAICSLPPHPASKRGAT